MAKILNLTTKNEKLQNRKGKHHTDKMFKYVKMPIRICPMVFDRVGPLGVEEGWWVSGEGGGGVLK